MATTEVTYSYIDESEELCRISLNLAEILADGSNWDTVVSNVGSSLALLGTGLSTLTRCNEYQSAIRSVRQKTDPSAPADVLAQREWVARMTYSDDVTGKLYRFDIPGPEALFLAGTDKVDMSTVGMLAFKAVFEAAVVSEAGNAVTLVRGIRSGKRN